MIMSIAKLEAQGITGKFLTNFPVDRRSRMDAVTAKLFRDRNICLSLTINTRKIPGDKGYQGLVRAVNSVRAFLGEAPDLLQRETNAYELFGKEPRTNNPLYFPDENTNYHAKDVVGDNGKPILINFVSPELRPYILNEVPSYYEALSPHPGLASISFHLGFASTGIGAHHNHNIATTSVLQKDAVMGRCIEGLTAFKDNIRALGYKGPLLFETLDFHAQKGGSCYKYVTDPDFIRDVREKTGFGLLLDPAHMLIAAKHKNLDPFEYVDGILKGADPASIREIHLSMPRHYKTGWSDIHHSFYGNLRREEAGLALSMFAYIFARKRDSGFASPTTINLETRYPRFPDDIRFVVEFLRRLLP